MQLLLLRSLSQILRAIDQILIQRIAPQNGGLDRKILGAIGWSLRPWIALTKAGSNKFQNLRKRNSWFTSNGSLSRVQLTLTNATKMPNVLSRTILQKTAARKRFWCISYTLADRSLQFLKITEAI